MTLWIIEARDAQGMLDLKCPQPESVFGMKAITGMQDQEMAQVIFRRLPNKNVTLDGGAICAWPKLLHPNWSARRKTW